MKPIHSLLLGLASILVVGTSSAQEPEQALVSNPLYEHWSTFKEGTWVQSTTESKVAGESRTTEQTVKLAEVAPERAVLSIRTVIITGEERRELPETRRVVPARMPKSDEAKSDEAPVADPGDGAKVHREGHEVIEVKGRRISCHWVETEDDTPLGRKWSKIWTSDQVPGQVVKALSKVTGDADPTSSETLVTEFLALSRS